MREFGKKIKGALYLFRPGSYGVIIEDKRIGVIRSKIFGKYFLVGGALSAGESETEALQREAFEEIGFEIEIREKIGTAIEYFYAEADGQYIAKECNFYRVSLLNKVEDKTENRLLWIRENELDEMYHQSHQWIVEQELNL